MCHYWECWNTSLLMDRFICVLRQIVISDFIFMPIKIIHYLSYITKYAPPPTSFTKTKSPHTKSPTTKLSSISSPKTVFPKLCSAKWKKGSSRKFDYNNKFWEELIAYFPWYHTGYIENESFNNSSIVASVFVTVVTFLPNHWLATIGGFLPSCCLETIGGYTYRHTDWWEGYLIRPLRWAHVPWCTYQVS
jgi:hypothetical protein